MTYTLWSHGDLLGESALDYVRVFPQLRTGDLHVTPKGLIAFDRLSQTHADGYYAMRRVNTKTLRGTFEAADEETLFADLAAEHDQYEALALELRAPDGSVIATGDIHIRDTDYLRAIASERDDEDELATDVVLEDVLDPADLTELEDQFAGLEEDRPPWARSLPEREPVRFQISVTLKNEWSVP